MFPFSSRCFILHYSWLLNITALVKRLLPGAWSYFLHSKRSAVTCKSVKMSQPVQISPPPPTPDLQHVCMHVIAAGDRPFSPKGFHGLLCMCMCAYRLTSSIVLGAAGAWGHICLLWRGHHRHCYPTGHLLSSREEKDRKRLMLWLNYFLSSSFFGWIYSL